MKKLLTAIATSALLLLTSLPASAEDTNSHKVRLKTSLGDIILQLDAEKAPITVENFENYVKKGFYDGLIFHRVIGNFMIQGGGYEPKMIERIPGDAINNEAYNGLSNQPGTIAMARRQHPHSASSQFFINVNNNAPLDHTGKTLRGWGYTVFGRVIEGMDTVNRIKSVKTVFKYGFRDVPAEDVIIEKAEMLP